MLKRHLILFGLLILMFNAFGQSMDLQIGINAGSNNRFYKIKVLTVNENPLEPQDTISESTINGVSFGGNFGFFLRVTMKKKYFEFGVNVSRWSVPVFGTTKDTLDNSSISGVGIPLVVGYKFVNTAMFKWRVATGLDFIILGKVKENEFGITRGDFTNPRVGMRFGTGIDLAFFTMDVNYILGLTSEFKSLHVRTQSHGIEFLMGFLF